MKRSAPSKLRHSSRGSLVVTGPQGLVEPEPKQARGFAAGNVETASDS